MNNLRRKQIQEIIDKLEALKDDIVAITEEEQDYHDNIPENLQGGERFEASLCAIEMLENAQNSLDEVIEALQDAKE